MGVTEMKWGFSKPERCFDFVWDVTFPDGAEVKAGQTIIKKWELKCVCPGGATGRVALRTKGSFGPKRFCLPDAQFGQTIIVSAEITVPSKAGLHRATYHIYNEQGLTAGGLGFWIEIQVV